MAQQLSKITVKKWSEMTQEEKEAAVRLDRNLRAHQDTVKVKEAALDALMAYLKTCKRKRPAPTMLYQFPGYDERKFSKLVAAVDAAQVAEDAAQHAWLHDERTVSGCSGCAARVS